MKKNNNCANTSENNGITNKSCATQHTKKALVVDVTDYSYLSERESTESSLTFIIEELSRKEECSCMCSYIKELKQALTLYYKIMDGINAMAIQRTKAQNETGSSDENSDIIDSEAYTNALVLINKDIHKDGFPTKEMKSDFEKCMELVNNLEYKKDDFYNGLKKSIHLFHPSVPLFISSTYQSVSKKLNSLKRDFTS